VIAFDVVAAAAIAFFAFNGMRKGLISELFKILGVIAGLIIGLQTMTQSAHFVHGVYPIGGDGEKAMGFVIVFVVIMIVSVVLASFVKKIFKWIMLGWLDRGGGVLFGGIKGALIVSSLMPIIAILPDSIPHVKDIRRDSYAYHYLNGFAPKVYDTIGKAIPGSKSFATKIKESFPSMDSITNMGGMGGAEAQEQSMKQVQQLLGGSDNKTLESLQKQVKGMPGMEDLKGVDLNKVDFQALQKEMNKNNQSKKK